MNRVEHIRLVENQSTNTIKKWVLVLCSSFLATLIIIHFKIIGLIGLFILPLFIVFLVTLFLYPKVGLWTALIVSFLSAGLARYISIPWGLSLDILLTLTWIVIIIKGQVKWSRLNNDIFILSLLWFLYLVFEIFNANATSFQAWFYAMRGIGFYQFLTFGLIFLLFDTKKDVDRFFTLIIALSILGALWGFKQQMGVLDSFENHWLYEDNHHEEHILYGVLRVFSFYSDAGQFGASQAMIALLCSILLLGKGTVVRKVFLLTAGITCFIGFAISGTRGALAVPFFGSIIYLFANRNFSLLLSGMAVIGMVFFILKFTFLFQGVEQVRRMRSALDPNNKSLQVRLDNQKTFGRYLSDKPFGAGVGTAGYWGARFNPTSLMAMTATDSWYVKIWAETGVVGICIHLGMMGYIMGRGYRTVSSISDKRLRNQSLALYASIGGILFSSYGNQVFGQMPTGMIMNIAIPMLFVIKNLETKH